MLTIGQLLEVGRVLSRANEAKLRAAVDALSAVLSALGPAKEATDRSFENRRTLLCAALEDEAEAANPGAEYYPRPWVTDVFDTHFVYCSCGDYFDRPYTIDDAGVVTMGAPAEVTPRMVYDPAPPEDPGAGEGVAESAIVGDIQPLLESGNLRESSTAQLRLIAPGWGSSGYYSPEVLRRDGPGVFTKGTQMFWDHPTTAEESARPEGSLSKLAAQLETDARWEESGAAGPGLYARAKVYERYAEDLAELAEDIGVSIRASGVMKSGEAEGRKGPIVERIVSARSVDFVTRPGAGGRVLELFEAAGRRAPAAPTPAAEGRDSNLEQSMTEQERQEMQALREANAANAAELARLRERELFREAHTFATTRLAGLDLPQITRDRLAEQLARNPVVVSNGALDTAAFGARIDEAAAAEARYIEQVTGRGRVRDLGATGGNPQPVTEAQLAEQFVALGMSESAAKIAARGSVQ